jgi:hypothetical protein
VEDKGILAAIALMGEINEGKSDKETHAMIKQIIKAMTEKKRQVWPDKRLRKLVNEMDGLSRKYFLATLHDMDEALTDYYEHVGVEL